MENKVRVRFAPSPTGVPHIGNMRTALFDYFQAKANDGIFLLRIEDTDQARRVEGSIEAVKESLEWLGTPWDEIAVQSERLEEYKKYANQLVESGLASVEEGGAVRFKISQEGGDIEWEDAIGKRPISYKRESLEDFIILKADGYPTYHLANVVDDHLMRITHVIRGEDWIPSTPKHILLYKAFDWEEPIFAHVPNVLGEDRKKLSKRKGAKSVLDFRDEGYLSEALLNCLMLLGWSPGNDREFFTKEEIIEEFKLSRVTVAPGIFSVNKLNSMNAEYIRALDNETLLQRLYGFDPSLKEFDSELVSQLVEIAKTRITVLSDFKRYIFPFMDGAPRTPESELKTEVVGLLENVENWTNDEIFEPIRALMREKGYKLPQIYEALIGERQGLPLSSVFEILGRERTLSLLK